VKRGGAFLNLVIGMKMGLTTRRDGIKFCSGRKLAMRLSHACEDRSYRHNERHKPIIGYSKKFPHGIGQTCSVDEV